MAKLTPAQKKVRALVWDAAKRVIAEADSRQTSKNAVEFDVNFHLSCWEYKNGNPNHKFAWPIHIPLHARI